jgi:L-ascorbate metabolism protein UlaG (beta-lactamase superfamily)
MIRPRLSGEAFLAEVRSRGGRGEDELDIWWLGQSGFLLAWRGRRLLFDPYLSDSLERKYAQTDKPHVRMTGIIVEPGQLDFIDVVTSSHNHTDHLDAGTLGPMIRANPEMALVIPEANREFVATRLGTPLEYPTGVVAGERIDVNGFAFTGVPSAHNELETDHLGRDRYMGYVVEFGPWTVYQSGDTLRYPGMERRLRGFDIDVAFLPINGNAPERRVAGNLTGREAAQLARDVGVRLVVPCHYEMFEFNTASPQEFAAEAARLGQPARVLACGELLTLTLPPKARGFVP